MSTRGERQRLQGEMEELFSGLHRLRSRLARRAFRPPVDVFRSEDPPEVTVVVDLAGVDPEDIELGVSGEVLTIAGVRRRPPVGEVHYQQVELDYGPFERRIAVGGDIAGKDAGAVYDRGILTIRLPVEPSPARPVTLVIGVVRRS